MQPAAYAPAGASIVRQPAGTAWNALLLALHALLLVWLLLPAPGRAQDLPDWEYNSVNDFAGLLENSDVERIDKALIALFEETDIEGTVVTIADRARHGGSDGLEPFATRLFNDWGVGDAGRNDGFMLLVSRDDREVRIELGAGYGAQDDRTAGRIIDRVIIPAFRDGQMSSGIANGLQAIVGQIARPHAGLPAASPTATSDPGPVTVTPLPAPAREMPMPAPAVERRDRPGLLDHFFDMVTPFLPVFFVGIFAFVLARGRSRRSKNLFGQYARIRKCPECGSARVTRDIQSVSDTMPGGAATHAHRLTMSCPDCGWQIRQLVPNSVSTGRSDSYYGPGWGSWTGWSSGGGYYSGSGRSSGGDSGFGGGRSSGWGSSRSFGGGGGFGGGRSSGGGSSGKW